MVARSLVVARVHPPLLGRRGWVQPRCALELPCGLRFDMVGKDVVERLGEPDKKGGGGKAPLLLVYKGLGLRQVALAVADWNRGKSSPVEAIDVFSAA